MRKGSKKPILIYTGALAGALTLAVGSAFAGEIGPDTAAGMQKLQGAQLQCSPGEITYQSPNGPYGKMIPDPNKLQACNKCKTAVDQQKQKVEQSRKQAIQQNNAVIGAGAAGTGATSAAANGQATNSENSAGLTHSIGSGAQAQRSALAKALGQDAQTCSSQVQSSCGVSLASSDKQAAESAAQGCQQIADASNANSAEKAASSGGMGDLSQLAGALGQALGQMMQGGQGADPATTPDISSVTPDPVAGTNIDPVGTNVAGTSIGNNPNGVDGVQFSKPNSANISGFTPNGTSFGPATSGSSYDTAGTGYGNDGYGGGSAGIAGYTGSGSGGSAGLNSSGASVAGLNGDAAGAAGAGDAASAGPNDEINLASGGGGAKPSFLGLKSSADEEQPGEPGVLDDLGLGSDEEGSRDLASNEEAGIAAENSGTLFTVIHTKISEIKRRGSI